MSSIVFYEGNAELYRYSCDEWGDGAVLTVGRDEPADIRLPNVVGLSRMHLSIKREGDAFFVSDEGSSNGTVFLGSPISAPTLMLPTLPFVAAALSVVLELGDAPAVSAVAAPVEPVYEPEPFVEAAPVEPAYEPEPFVEAAPVEPAYEPEPVVEAAPVEPAYEPEPFVEAAPVEPAAPVAAPVVAPVVAVSAYEASPLTAYDAAGVLKPFKQIKGMPKGGVPQQFQAELKLAQDGPVLYEGDVLRFEVRVSRPSHIMIIGRQSNGETQIVFPNAYYRKDLVPAGEWTSLPPVGDENFEICVAAPFGMDGFQLIARSVVPRSAPGEAPNKPEWAHAQITAITCPREV